MARPSDPTAKTELLRAAEAVFVEAGLDHARVEDITSRAGRSKGSFYLHFESKEDAFRTIIETLMARLATCISELAALEVDDLPSLRARQLEKDLEVFEFLWQNRKVCALVLSGGGSARFGYLIDAFAEQARGATKKWLAVGVEKGLYRSDLDLELASLVISGAYDRVARHLFKLNQKPDLRAWLGSVQSMVLEGICDLGVSVAEASGKRRATRRR